MALTQTQCLNAQGTDKAYKLTDGGGLYLEVHPNGSKYWLWQYRLGEKRSRISLGVYPRVSLKEARDKHTEFRKLLEDGIDPAHYRKKQKLQRQIELGTSFERIAREWHEINLTRWKPRTADGILVRLEHDVFPAIGSLPISDITPAEVLATIRKIEGRGALELARKSLQYINRIFQYAKVTSRVDDNPAKDLSQALRPQVSNHYRAMDYRDLPDFMLSLRTNSARLYPITQKATELLLLTFVRTSELIGARWEEFDLEAAIWIIPGERMKMGKDHIVPLSRQALNHFQTLREIAPTGDYVFPHYSDPARHMSNGTINKVITTLGFKDKTTGHGFRALAMSTIKEQLGYRHEVVDRQLAHAHKSKVDAAYDRAQFLDERRKMMQDWADYIDQAYKDALLDGL